MAIKDVLQEINLSVKDILRMDFELSRTQNDYVPNHEDPGLTFESGQTKRAKTIETCVLYADIRNSTALSRAKPQKDMARLYTAFTKGVMNLAEFHGGVIRNIIGDRVMVVFPRNNCFEAAIDTAISINTFSIKIMSKHFAGFNFKCGIGIDYGEKLVIKAGIPKQDKERANYKNLIWVSNSANIASKLTDLANKDIAKPVYQVTQHPINPRKFTYPGLWGLSNQIQSNPAEPLYLSSIETIEQTPEEFGARMSLTSGGELFATGGKILKFEKTEKKISLKPILVSEKVFEEYKKLNPSRDTILRGHWVRQSLPNSVDVSHAYGCDLIWTVSNEVIW